MAAIGLKLAAPRKGLGLSQKEMAKRLDISQGFVSRLEGGEKIPSLETLLGVQPSEFLDYDLVGANDLLETIRTGASLPVDLRSFANDEALIAALQIKPGEWRALASIKTPSPVSKDGYVQFLITMRAISA